MDVRYQVFISSTFRDMTDARKAITAAIVDCGHIPVALERFGASDEKDLKVIEKAVAESQIYVVVLGHRYGSLVADPEEGFENKSYTEYEYLVAKRKGLLIIPFALKEDIVRKKRNELDRTRAKDQEELKNESLLWKFHEEIRSEHFYRPYDTGTDFEKEMLRVFADLYRRPEKIASIPPGFIKAQKGLDNQTVVSLGKNQFIREAVNRLNSFTKLEERISDENVDKKKALADLLWQCYGQTITSRRVGLFLESGSTTSYVADRMKERLQEFAVIEEDGSPSIDIKTNNALVFLQFWLSAQIPCSVFPWGSPDGTFGASYGPVGNLVKREPYYPPQQLNQFERAAIDQLNRLPFGLRTEDERPRLTISAISGIQLGSSVTIDKVDELPSDCIDELSECRGLHVGSYHNKIFKLFLYQTGIPAIICAHEDKIDRPIKVGHCHFLYTSDEWQKLLQEHPLAFCIGCDRENLESVSDRFSSLGFSIVKGSKSKGTNTAFIAKNERFIQEFERM